MLLSGSLAKFSSYAARGIRVDPQPPSGVESTGGQLSPT